MSQALWILYQATSNLVQEVHLRRERVSAGPVLDPGMWFARLWWGGVGEGDLAPGGWSHRRAARRSHSQPRVNSHLSPPLLFLLLLLCSPRRFFVISTRSTFPRSSTTHFLASRFRTLVSAPPQTVCFNVFTLLLVKSREATRTRASGEWWAAGPS